MQYLVRLRRLCSPAPYPAISGRRASGSCSSSKGTVVWHNQFKPQEVYPDLRDERCASHPLDLLQHPRARPPSSLSEKPLISKSRSRRQEQSSESSPSQPTTSRRLPYRVMSVAVSGSGVRFGSLFPLAWTPSRPASGVRPRSRGPEDVRDARPHRRS